MHAFVIHSSEFTTQPGPDTLILESEGSIGIEEVRQIQAFLSRKPLQADSNSVYVLAAHQLTVPAQNALLKTLEEPPSNSQIFLVTDFSDQLLPTVLSRVQITSTQKTQEVTPQKMQKIQDTLDRLTHARAGERLAIIDALGFTREQALEFLDHLEHLFHANLKLKLDYQKLVDTRKYLKANVNVKLALDHLVLSL